MQRIVPSLRFDHKAAAFYTDVFPDRRRWEESRGDKYDDRSATTYYFWIHDGGLEQRVGRIRLGCDRRPRPRPP